MVSRLPSRPIIHLGRAIMNVKGRLLPALEKNGGFEAPITLLLQELGCYAIQKIQDV